MKITNTWYKLPPRRLYTWKAPGDRPGNMIRNQIDYILINKRFGTSVKRVCTYPGADVPSDHVLLMAIIKIKIMTIKTHVPQRKIDYERLKDKETKNKVTKNLNEKIWTTIDPQTVEKASMGDIWEEIEDAMNNADAEAELGHRRKVQKHDWMTDEILARFEERRRYKNKGDGDNYKKIQKVIGTKIRTAKNEWLKQQCEELEQLQRIHDDFNLHRKIEETAGIHRKNPFSNVENDQGELAQDDLQRKTIWENYISNLFADVRPAIENLDDEDLSGSSITKEEIIRAINTSKDRKAIGPDRIP